MKSSRGHNTHEEDEEYDDDFTSKKDGSSSNNKDAKNNDKASAVRSKHSVTEQRRRSKINERFQILRDLMPHGDQKRDTASFLLEVIDYVQLLQEKVQKYEGSYEGWGTEPPTKLMPWRHSHWRVQSYLGHPQTVKNGSGPGPGPASTILGKFDEKSLNPNPGLAANAQTTVEADDAFRILEQSELGESVTAMPTSFQVHTPSAVRIDGDDSHLSQRPASDAQSTSCTIRTDHQHGEHVIEGGTISISSAYSHGLLTTLTQALQSSGVDLSHASISIRINLGNRANTDSVPGMSGSKEVENQVSRDLKKGHVSDGSGREDFNQPLKKLKQ